MTCSPVPSSIDGPADGRGDTYENYENMPPFQFIKDVPVVWDTTIAINGEIGEYVTIARKDRFSQDWYLGSITNDVERDFEIDLSFLREGIYEATIYADHPNFDWESNPNKYKGTSSNDVLYIHEFLNGSVFCKARLLGIGGVEDDSSDGDECTRSPPAVRHRVRHQIHVCLLYTSDAADE